MTRYYSSIARVKKLSAALVFNRHGLINIYTLPNIIRTRGKLKEAQGVKLRKKWGIKTNNPNGAKKKTQLSAWDIIPGFTVQLQLRL